MLGTSTETIKVLGSCNFAGTTTTTLSSTNITGSGTLNITGISTLGTLNSNATTTTTLSSTNITASGTLNISGISTLGTLNSTIGIFSTGVTTPYITSTNMTSSSVDNLNIRFYDMSSLSSANCTGFWWDGSSLYFMQSNSLTTGYTIVGPCWTPTNNTFTCPGPIVATTSTFSGLISGSNGLTISSGNSSLLALTSTTLNATTGTFSSNLTANSDLRLTASGSTSFIDLCSLNATSDVRLQVTGGSSSSSYTGSLNIYAGPCTFSGTITASAITSNSTIVFGSAGLSGSGSASWTGNLNCANVYTGIVSGSTGTFSGGLALGTTAYTPSSTQIGYLINATSTGSNIVGTNNTIYNVMSYSLGPGTGTWSCNACVNVGVTATSSTNFWANAILSGTTASMSSINGSFVNGVTFVLGPIYNQNINVNATIQVTSATTIYLNCQVGMLQSTGTFPTNAIRPTSSAMNFTRIAQYI